MSNYDNIQIDKYTIEDFISIESGTEKITLTIFVGSPKNIVSVELNIKQSAELVQSIEKHRDLLIKQK